MITRRHAPGLGTGGGGAGGSSADRAQAYGRSAPAAGLKVHGELPCTVHRNPPARRKAIGKAKKVVSAVDDRAGQADPGRARRACGGAARACPCASAEAGTVRDPQGQGRPMRRALVVLCAVAVLWRGGACGPGRPHRAERHGHARAREGGPGLQRRGLCARARRATVSWNASCGPAAPADALREVDVGIYGVRPNGTRFGYDGEALEEDPPLTGSMAMTAGPGLRFFGEVTVTCSRGRSRTPRANEVEHTRARRPRRRQPSSTCPPQLMVFRTTRSGFCGVNVPNEQARQVAPGRPVRGAGVLPALQRARR